MRCKYVCSTLLPLLTLAVAVDVAKAQDALSALGGVASALGGEAKAGTWRQSPTPPWGPRSQATALSFKGRLWLLGGRGPGPLGEVWSSADGRTWREDTPLGFPPRVGAGAVVFRDRMWIMGGADITGMRSDVYSSADGVAWKQETMSAPWDPRERFGCVAHNDVMYVFGGNGTAAAELNDVWYSNNGTDWFTSTVAAGWSPRAGFGALEYNNLLWLFGGFESGTYYRDIWFSYDGASWARATDGAAWSSCYLSSIVPFDGKLWLVGNYNFSQDFYSSADAVNWRQETTPPWQGRYQHSVAVLNSRLWMLAGTTTSSGDTNEVWSIPAEGKLGAACGCAPGGESGWAAYRADAALVVMLLATLLAWRPAGAARASVRRPA